MPTIVVSMPVTISGRGPNLGSSLVLERPELSMIAGVIGRKARPDSIGLKPSVSCR